MRLRAFVLLAIAAGAARPALGSVIFVDFGCLTVSGANLKAMPKYDRQSLNDLDQWFKVGAAMQFLTDKFGIEYNKARYDETCPNRGFFNFARATNCVGGLTTEYDLTARSLTALYEKKGEEEAKKAAYKIIGEVSERLHADYRSMTGGTPPAAPSPHPAPADTAN